MAGKSRIEASFLGKSITPDPDGTETVEVYVASKGLDPEAVREIDYVTDVERQSNELKVTVTAE